MTTSATTSTERRPVSICPIASTTPATMTAKAAYQAMVVACGQAGRMRFSSAKKTRTARLTAAARSGTTR